MFAAARSLWTSTDKGMAWTKTAAPLASQGPFLFGDWTGGKVGGMLIKGTEAVSYSKDAGQTWKAIVGGDSGNAFPPKHDAKVDGFLYAAKATDWIYDADATDYRLGSGIWAFDPVHNIVYASAMGGPVLAKQLPGAGPGPAPAPGGAR